MSIAGQCQHIFRNRAVIDKLSPGFKTDVEDVESLARHIAEFSLCALRGMAEGGFCLNCKTCVFPKCQFGK